MASVSASPAAANRTLVAVIDGNSAQRDQFAKALTSFYAVADYPDMETAVARMRSPPKVLLVDETVKPGGHRQLVRSLRLEPTLKGVPIILCKAKFKPVELVGRMPDAEPDAVLEKPFRRSDLINAISGLVNCKVEAGWAELPAGPRLTLEKTLSTFNHIADLIEKGEPLAQETLNSACAPLVSTVLNSEYRHLLGAVRGHDNFTYVHSLRFATLLVLLGHAIGLKDGALMILATGGMVHDIGKMSIPHDVMNKPGPLDGEERKVMRRHVQAGVEYLRRHTDVPKGVMTIAAEHHERLDGSGYPAGLSGSQLNDLARMSGIVDVFVAMTDRRPYRANQSAEAALEKMVAEMGDQLDMRLLKLFRSMLMDAADGAWA